MNNKLYHYDLAYFNEGEFRINSNLEVFFGKKEIGVLEIIHNNDPEGDDEIACFLPGHVGFQHPFVHDAATACKTIYQEYNSQNHKTN